MADETSKQFTRRAADHRYVTRWIRGDGIDVGCGEDCLSKLAAFFPMMRSVRGWDLPDGDAMLLEGVADDSLDFVHSSHCLEHLADPARALGNWIRVCRPGGHVLVTVPDEDLYEQGVWPSSFNGDHKWSFTIAKRQSWSPRSVSLFHLLDRFADEVEVLKLELLDSGYAYGAPRHDQTRGALAEAAIEFVLRKRARPAPALPVAAPEVSPEAAPDAADEAVARADALEREGRPVEAIRALEPAARSDTAAAIRLGQLLQGDERPEEAMACLQSALDRHPGHPAARQARVELGFAQLGSGDYREGGRNITAIWEPLGLSDQVGMFADETGEPRNLSGRTALLSADSGLGDALQFVRYGRLLKEQGAAVVVDCQPELVRLLGMQPWIDAVAARGDALPPHDVRVPMHNLLAAFGTTLGTVPNGTPYLAADPAEVAGWAKRLAAYPGLKVGLAWAGSPDHVHDRIRSVDPSVLRPLDTAGGVQLVSLQKGIRQDGPCLPGMLDWTEELSDVADTAALVAALDLVVAVDTSVVHLAGALGRPVWLLNRFGGCWRWMRHRADSPWYPTLRQFRQPRRGAWQPVVQAVAAALAEQARASQGAELELA